MSRIAPLYTPSRFGTLVVSAFVMYALTLVVFVADIVLQVGHSGGRAPRARRTPHGSRG